MLTGCPTGGTAELFPVPPPQARSVEFGVGAGVALRQSKREGHETAGGSVLAQSEAQSTCRRRERNQMVGGNGRHRDHTPEEGLHTLRAERRSTVAACVAEQQLHRLPGQGGRRGRQIRLEPVAILAGSGEAPEEERPASTLHPP